ncbi:ECF transporter S component [Proteinivorax hydrogeniformans]|uniref:ECF transporter S component n=1 Tax=Proteinivorax hydrogeniformans TaxID=1826727 RepID=A0AAU8HSV0_9FIRM
MNNPSSFLERFSIYDLMIIALMACLGLAVKPIVVPLAYIITGPFFIPGGVVAGGFYMMWIVMGAALVGKTGSATLIALVQAIVVISVGFFGTHGIMSLATYILPGVAVDLIFLISRHKGCCAGCCFAAGIAANVSGSFLVNLVFFRLPFVPLVLSLAVASLSGGIGGIIAHKVVKQFKDKLAW